MMSSPVLISKKRKSSIRTNHLKTPLPYDKERSKKPHLISPNHESSPILDASCLEESKISSRSKSLSAELDESLHVSTHFESFYLSPTKDENKSVLVTPSLNSQDGVDSQDSQPLKARIRKKLSKNPSYSLYNTRKRNEIALKNNALDSIFNDLDSQPGFELGPFFGLPSRIAELFSKLRGISKLYEWQEECIQEGIKGGNLLISLPTSGGKTLVAEILMLRHILIFEKDVLVILPYVALVQEKVRGLSPFAVDLEFLIEEYAGTKGIFPPKKRKKKVVYIATIEKANILLDSLMEEGRLDELGLVVFDEVHMLGDSGGRGAKLEIALVKFKYASKSAQIVSMSATVGNLEELSSFLDAKLYTGSFRPIPLTEYVKAGDQIAEINPKALSEEDLLASMQPYTYLNSDGSVSQSDPECFMGLISDIIPEHSCLVFCATRRNVEAVALVLKSNLSEDFLTHRQKEKNALLRALKEELGGNSVCHVLQKTIPYGIAYHHSGLTEGERKLIEEGYQCNTLCCLVCTSTLAAGVNLPARRVIIRSPYTGREFLTRSRYQQMIGRAGRAGLDSKGESFIISSQKDLPKVGELLLAPVEKCISKLDENDFEGLSELVFSMLGLKLITTFDEALSLVSHSLLSLQANQSGLDINGKVRKLLEKQYYKGFLCLELDPSKSTKKGSEDRLHSDLAEALSGSSPRGGEEESTNPKRKKSISISRLGKAAIKGGINLSLASRLYSDLVAARSHLALHSHLHLLSLVTPYTPQESLVFKAQVFSDIYHKLTKEELEVVKILGITEAVSVKLIIGAPTKLDKLFLNRFYATLVLHQLLRGRNILAVSETFDVHRGSVQQLLFSAASFAACVNRFCQELDELWAFQDLFGAFSNKLSQFCSAELIPLMELPGVKTGRARLLHRAGFRTLSHVANADVKAIVKAVDHLSYKVAYQIISSAKMLLLQKAEALQEEAEDLLKGLGDDPEMSFLSTYQMTST